MASNTYNTIFSSILIILLFFQTRAETLHTHKHNHTYTSAFDFIKHLQGCHKGLNVSGLNELKKYLHHFGYLKNVDGNDEFNADLESAIKIYQINFNLNVTGTLDAVTTSQMMVPRCGMPDIVDGVTTMGGSHEKRKLLSQHMVSHYAFFRNKNKWPGTSPSLTYGFSNNGNNGLFTGLIVRAFRQWIATTGKFGFSRVNNVNNANIKIGFYTGDHGDSKPFDGPGGALAHAYAPKDGRLHFDGAEDFSYLDSAPRAGLGNQIHLQSVAVHEIGHILGLSHSSDPGAIMFPSLSKGQIKIISRDDIDGIHALYRA